MKNLLLIVALVTASSAVYAQASESMNAGITSCQFKTIQVTVDYMVEGETIPPVVLPRPTVPKK